MGRLPNAMVMGGPHGEYLQAHSVLIAIIAVIAPFRTTAACV